AGCAQGATIARLSTSLGIERGAIEDRCRLSLELADLQHARLKRLEIWVLQVEAFRHRGGRLAHSHPARILREQRELAVARGLRRPGDVAPAIPVRARPLLLQVLLEIRARCGALQPLRLL